MDEATPVPNSRVISGLPSCGRRPNVIVSNPPRRPAKERLVVPSITTRMVIESRLKFSDGQLARTSKRSTFLKEKTRKRRQGTEALPPTKVVVEPAGLMHNKFAPLKFVRENSSTVVLRPEKEMDHPRPIDMSRPGTQRKPARRVSRPASMSTCHFNVSSSTLIRPTRRLSSIRPTRRLSGLTVPNGPVVVNIPTLGMSLSHGNPLRRPVPHGESIAMANSGVPACRERPSQACANEHNGKHAYKSVSSTKSSCLKYGIYIECHKEGDSDDDNPTLREIAIRDALLRKGKKAPEIGRCDSSQEITEHPNADLPQHPNIDLPLDPFNMEENEEEPAFFPRILNIS
uniref:Uncharacterized protein n=1 Tax=Ananas comosus var. bracteatus TaxID=296719 RepID=A0A6V7NER0_ANACO|nr:unnamed protein product [Ananas comosus var. bracteatus]